MTKKKVKPSAALETEKLDGARPSPPTKPAQPKNGDSAPASTSAKGSKGPKSGAASAASPSLIICRNKHWRYISCFHGPWLQMPIEILEAIANVNYNTPRPRPIDPAVFFDLVKVRRLVDEASNLAVRAASDIASPTLTNVNGGTPINLNTLGLGPPGHGAKLSRERKFRMREQASQKLSRAYRLDEIACSVATMQGASPLEDVGSLVLQRNPTDPDAKYVHFFHEKIPSRQLVESTTLLPLLDIVALHPGEPEVLRTIATVKCFKADYEGAILDINHALSILRFRNPPNHKTARETDLQAQETPRARRRPQDIILSEQEQPSSLEGQLYFQRASACLTMACHHVLDSFDPLYYEDAPEGDDTPLKKPSPANGEATAPLDDELLKIQAESRRMAKTFGKRALKDYMSFLARFEYTPDLPPKVAKDFNDRVSYAAHGMRNHRLSDTGTPPEPHTVYPLSDLFAPIPPSDLPPYPTEHLIKHGLPPDEVNASTNESLTYHPLLTDALHSLLLCHCLVQTSVKELQRHAYMVARLVRLTDGYPVFQASRSPARTDWIEVVRRADNWLNLGASWEVLCAPAPLSLYDNWPTPKQHINPGKAASAAAALLQGSAQSLAAAPGSEERRKERIRQQAIIDALNDERVMDEASFRASIQAREKRAEEETASPPANDPPRITNGTSRPIRSASPGRDPALRRWSPEDGKEYPILTERATAIAQWVTEAPVIASTPRRKKRVKKANGTATKLEEVEAGVGGLELDE